MCVITLIVIITRFICLRMWPNYLQTNLVGCEWMQYSIFFSFLFKMSSHSSSNLKENIEDIVIDEDRLKMIYENTIYNGTLEEFHEYVKNKIKEGDLFAVYLFKVWDGREESSAEDENEKENQEKTTTDEDEDENKDCENCVNCKESKNCKDCESCVACVNCVKCKHSPGCEDCVRCERCSDMNYCGICEDCEHCARCKKCYECENCVDCEHCTNCHYCWGLKRGRDLWGNTMTKDEWEALDEKK